MESGGCNIVRCVALEERLRHLRATGVVCADEEHVLHRLLRSGYVLLVELVDQPIHALRDVVADHPHAFQRFVLWVRQLRLT
jgi:hypothetical protein